MTGQHQQTFQVQQLQEPQQSQQRKALVDEAEKSELVDYRERVDKAAEEAAQRSSKEYADDDDAYLREEFQAAGTEAVRLAERKYRRDPKKLRRLRRRRGQQEVSDSSSSSDSSASDSSDSEQDRRSDSDDSERPRKRRKKSSEKKKSERKSQTVVEWRKFKKGRARCKGRSKWERRAERYYARELGVQSRFTSTSLEMEARHLHQVRMLLAQMAATTATPRQMVHEATSMLENMTDALLAFDGEMVRSMDSMGPCTRSTEPSPRTQRNRRRSSGRRPRRRWLEQRHSCSSGATKSRDEVGNRQTTHRQQGVRSARRAEAP